MTHGCVRRAEILLRNNSSLSGIPGVFVQGRLDMGNMAGTPWELAHAWPGSDLILVDDAGHDSRDSGTPESLVAATARFAATVWADVAGIWDPIGWESAEQGPAR